MLRRNIIQLLRLSATKNIKVLEEQRICPTIVKRNGICLCCQFLTTKIRHENQNVTNKLTEEEYLVKIKDDPDTFGNQSSEEIEYEGSDLKEEEYLTNPPDPAKKLNTKQYADMIKAFVRKKKIKEAIDVLEIRMLQTDRVKPENYIYNLLLGACGRVGYTKKAFSLYNKMKQRGLNVTGGTYTALFNACANSPWPEDGLSRARHLKEIMIEKGYEPNDTNYNAMIKAFGRCGDLETAFNMVDEMQTKKIPVKVDTLNFLLQACITDKEAGFRHALLVWRKFIEKNIKPDIYSYNLLLRCVRDCGLGDVDTTTNTFDNILVNKNLLLKSSELNNIQLQINSEDTNMEPHKAEDVLENRPNLIAKVPHLGNILSISEITKPEDRLLLIGGYSGFLNNMHENHCTPNIKTFTQLLDSIPATFAAEKELIISMKKLNVRADIDFYNMLIKKRSMRFDYEQAKEVLHLMKSAKLQPNIMTFGILALGCKTKEEAESLIQEMQDKNYRINAEILGAMLHQACYHNNFAYVLKTMEMCIEEDIQPNRKFIDCLEEFKKKCKAKVNDTDTNTTLSKRFISGFKIFNLRYKSWKEEVKPVNDDIHPWQQFRQEVETNVKHYKDKDLSSRFKPRHTSLYRQKKKSPIKNKNETSKNKGKLIINPESRKQINTT